MLFFAIITTLNPGSLPVPRQMQDRAVAEGPNNLPDRSFGRVLVVFYADIGKMTT